MHFCANWFPFSEQFCFPYDMLPISAKEIPELNPLKVITCTFWFPAQSGRKRKHEYSIK